MLYSGSHSGVASRTKYVLILAVVCWAVCATAWLIALTAHGHCSMARTTRVAVEQGVTSSHMSSSLQTTLNVTSQISTSQSPHAVQSGVLQYYSSKIYGGDGGDGCTMVMLTYKREGLLPRILNHYCKVDVLRRILVVWNDVGTAVPQALLNMTRGSCKANIKFILSKENRLTNRYLPRDEIGTECKSKLRVCQCSPSPMLILTTCCKMI